VAKPFNNLKSTKIGYTDKLTFGKFIGCRVCDIIEDQYEYLIFIEKGGFIKYDNFVTEKIKQVAGFELEKVHYEQEIRPWVSEDWDDDIPF